MSLYYFELKEGYTSLEIEEYFNQYQGVYEKYIPFHSIDKFIFIGQQEKYSQSINALGKILGVELKEYSENINPHIPIYPKDKFIKSFPMEYLIYNKMKKISNNFLGV